MRWVTLRTRSGISAGVALMAAVLALTLAGITLGAFRQTASVTLTAHRSGQSTASGSMLAPAIPSRSAQSPARSAGW